MALLSPEKKREYRERYYAKNRSLILQRRRARAAEFDNEKRRAAYAANPEKGREQSRQWWAANGKRLGLYSTRKGLNTLLSNRRRVRLVGNGGKHTQKEWLAKVDLLGGCCVYCGEAKPLERDHKLPLTRGGTDNIVNIVPACKTCNASKGTRTAREFIERRAA